MESFFDRLRKVRLFAMDFDGIHTDGLVMTNQMGTESVTCSRIDGLGLEILRNRTDICFCVISKESNPVVEWRCRKLQIPLVQAVLSGEGKLQILQRLAVTNFIIPEKVLYMGDDVNDLPCLKWAGVPITVPGSHPLVKDASIYETTAFGGRGAIREVCELILKARGLESAI